MDALTLDVAHGAWWIYTIVAIAAMLLAWWAYRITVPPMLPQRRMVLTALRAVALCALLLTLFEPVLHVVRSQVRTPRVAVLVDRSRSMQFKDRSGDRMQVLRASLRDAQAALGDRAVIAVFDDRVVASMDGLHADSLRSNGPRTDIAAALRWAGNQHDREGIGGIVLLTDGNANAGDDPFAIAERGGMPVLAVGIGDSVPPNDVAISSVDAPSLATVGEPATIGVDVLATGVRGRSFDVVVDEDGREIGRQRVDVGLMRQQQSLAVTYTPQTAGMRSLTARIAPIDGEFTTRNNAKAAFLRVVSNRKRVVLIAGAPSSDVAFLRDALSANPSMQLQAFVQRQGAGFYGETPTAAVLNDAAALVLVGFPTQWTPAAVVTMVADAAKRDRSLLFFASNDLDYSKLGPLADVLPFSVVSSRPREFAVTADVTGSAAADPVMRLGTDDDARRWNDLPPIYRTETFVDVHPQATVLATQRLNGVPMGDPLVVARDNGKQRVLAVLGHGIYRWRLLGKGPTDARGATSADVLSAFIENGVRWLSSNADRQRVRITTTQQFYDAGEAVAVIATVMDASMRPVDDADVRCRLSSGSRHRDVTLVSLGNGRYRADVGMLPTGDYSLSGSASRGTAQLGSDNGRFNVGAVNVEYLGTTMNVAMLRRLADVTGGAFVTPDRVTDGIERLLTDRRLRAETVTAEEDVALWSAWWLLAVAIAAFAVEWILRKRSGLV